MCGPRSGSSTGTSVRFALLVKGGEGAGKKYSAWGLGSNHHPEERDSALLLPSRSLEAYPYPFIHFIAKLKILFDVREFFKLLFIMASLEASRRVTALVQGHRTYSCLGQNKSHGSWVFSSFPGTLNYTVIWKVVVIVNNDLFSILKNVSSRRKLHVMYWLLLLPKKYPNAFSQKKKKCWIFLNTMHIFLNTLHVNNNHNIHFLLLWNKLI